MEDRIKICNQIIDEISRHSRKFFYNKEKKNRAKFFLEDTKLYYEDEYEKEKIWMKPKVEVMPHHFNHGGNLWGLIQKMRDFIYDGKKRCIFSRYWGYDFDSLVLIHSIAYGLGFTENRDFTLYNYGKERDEIYSSGELTFKPRKIK